MKNTGAQTIIPVLAAIIEDETGRVLIAQRKAALSQGELWEFPGGKIRPGESPESCLQREIAEELGLNIEVTSIFAATSFSYSDKHIFLVAYKARLLGGSLHLTDHQDVRWVARRELLSYPLSAADVPIAKKLIESE